MAQKVTSWEILNTIRTEASPLYASQVPEATRENIAYVGEIIMSYEPLVNEFTKLVGKIAMTITKNRVFNNKLAVFKKGMVETGDTIEEYILGKITSKVQLKPTATLTELNPFEVVLPKVKTSYYRENRSETYQATTSYKHMRKAFKSVDGVYKMIEDIVNQLYTSANIDEYTVMKEVIGSLTPIAHTYQVPKITSDNSEGENTKLFVKALKKALNDMEEPTSDFHRIYKDDGTLDGDFLTWANRDEMVLLLNKDIEPEIEVEVLAKAFNRGDVTLGVKQIIVGDFGNVGENIYDSEVIDEVYAILLDPWTAQFYDTYFSMKSIENPKGDYVNYFLHVDQILGLSPFTSVAVIGSVIPTPEP